MKPHPRRVSAQTHRSLDTSRATLPTMMMTLIVAQSADFDPMLSISTQDVCLSRHLPSQPHPSKTPLEWNLILMGNQDHLAVLPPMSESLERCHIEGTNNLILRHLRAICADKNFRDRWGQPSVIGLVQFIINDTVCSETGILRFDNQFGSYASTYMKLTEHLTSSTRSSKFPYASLTKTLHISASFHALLTRRS
jgi:hypothetical protein